MIGELLKSKSVAKLHGGLRFNKIASPPIEHLPIPDTLKILLKQHQGMPAGVIVAQGDTVIKGQPLTASDDLLQVPVHASSSGTVKSIDQHYITLATVRQHTEDHLESKLTNSSITRDQLIKILHHCGIVGMGGAGFSAAKKIESLPDTTNFLLINAAECDPIIHCDDALMQSHATEIVSGIKIIASACQISTIFIGFEDNKPEARLAIRAAIDQLDLIAKIITVPSIYPSGAENVLAQLCLDQSDSSPSASHLSEKGILSFNVATCFAIHQAVAHGMPLISRVTSIVDVHGNIRNFWTLIGTPVAHLLKHIQSDQDLQHQVTTGGHMMGTPISVSDATVKTSNCLAFNQPDSKVPLAKACIRCGACAEVCPEHLLPQQLHMHATSFSAETLQHYKIADCIECGCCDAVCPSHLPLTTSFQTAKQQLIENQQAKQLAEIAKIRFEKRQQRLSNKTELRTRNAAIKKPTAPDTPLLNTADNQDQKKKQLIEAALQRKRNKAVKNPQQGSEKN